MKSDIEIAQETNLNPITEIAAKLDLTEEDLELYGKYKAKISLDKIKELNELSNGNLILVTSINPTPAGEGKTTVTVGLVDGLAKLGKRVVGCLREPSLGPCFGIKGGACGGGHSQVVPMEDINLHFTGDIHAITSCHNLLAAVIDNSLYQGNPLNLHPDKIVFKRVIDLNDRALREIKIGLGNNGPARYSSFDITVASEIMAILCLASDLSDLKERLSKIIIGYTFDGQVVTAKDLNVVGSLTALLKDAIKPNLVQTLEGNPVLIHGGPFANIAHGCNSLIATKLGLKLANYVVTEAGFGADLGAEKFMDLKCRIGNIRPNVVVIVATIRALKMHAGISKDKLDEENLGALTNGFDNLEKHIENMQKYQIPVIVTINKFDTDTEEEIDLLSSLCQKYGVEVVVSDGYKKGGEGMEKLAEKVVDTIITSENNFVPIYNNKMTLMEKINSVAMEIYGASNIKYSDEAMESIKEITSLGYGNLPICIAKTQYSLTDNPKILGRPYNFTLNITDLKVNAGAGFITVYTGKVITMPGLPKNPVACNIDIDEDGRIRGLF